MFRGYWDEPERYRKCFAGGFYLTGDLARRDRDGYFWFVGRADDVIKTSGHLIGPFEVESVLMEHKAVAEAGVIGKPDPVAMRGRQGVRLAQGRLRADARAPPRAASICAHATRGGRRAEGDRVPAVPPQDPKREDHAAASQGPELGLPEGDTSTLEMS